MASDIAKKLRKRLLEIKAEETKLDNHFKEDIAPVREKGGNKDSWFKAGSFDDGYQFGDVTKAILGTAGDITVGAVKGAGRMVEGLVDLGTYGVAGVADLFGADEFADKAKEVARYSATDEWTKGITGLVDQHSLIGNKGDMISEGIGQVAAIVGTAGLASGALGGAAASAITTGTVGLSSMGTNMGEAYDSGASDAEAFWFGLGTGAIEAGTEMLFGGLGKGVKALGIGRGLSSLDDVFANKLSKSIVKNLSNETVQRAVGNTIEYAVKSGAEGVEEVLSGIGSAVMKKLTYMEDKELSELVKDEKLLEQFVVGTITSSLMQAGDLVKANKSGSDFVSGRTNIEDKVVEREADKIIADREAQEGPLSKKEKNKIYDSVFETLSRGYTSIDTIEETLGGESFEAYKKALDTKKEFDDLNGMKAGERTGVQDDRLKELKELGGEKYLADEIDKTKAKLSDDVLSIVKNDRNGQGSYLIESYNEKTRAGEGFKADYAKYKGAKYEDAARQTIDNAIKARANNTNRTHDIVDMAAKLSSENGYIYEFSSNENIKNDFITLQNEKIAQLEAIENPTEAQLQEIANMKETLQKVKDGKISINGNITANGIVLNLDSNDYLHRIVGHEITHTLEKTENYENLKSALFDYARSKGVDVDARLSSLEGIYKGIEGADIEGELTADLVGEYLFNDYDFVRRLSADKSVFQKIWDEIKYLCKIATAGSEQAQKLAKVERMFEKAFKESIEATTITVEEGTLFALSKSKQSESKALIQKLNENISKVSKENKYDVVASTKVEGVKSEYINGIFEAQGNIAKSPVLGTVELLKKGAESTIFHGFGGTKLASAHAIKDVIEKGDLISETINYENRNVDRYIIAARGTINGTDSYTVVAIEGYPAQNNKKQFYLHESITIETGSPIMTATQNTADTVSEPASTFIVSQSSEKSTPSEKVTKQTQFEIIQKSNPMWDDYHVGIRSADDIHTWSEILEFDDEREGQFVWGDFSREDALSALESGTITVYSSHPIENGTFVSTSYIQAQEYAGGKNGKVYSKTIPLDDVAWINGDEGQYAKVSAENDIGPTKHSLNENVNNDLISKYPNLNLNEDISELDGVPAIMLKDGSVLPLAEINGRRKTHVEFIQDNKISFEDIESGGWIGKGVYNPSFTSDTQRYIERMSAKKRVAEKNGKPFVEFEYSLSSPDDIAPVAPNAMLGKDFVIQDDIGPVQNSAAENESSIRERMSALQTEMDNIVSELTSLPEMSKKDTDATVKEYTERYNKAQEEYDTLSERLSSLGTTGIDEKSLRQLSKSVSEMLGQNKAGRKEIESLISEVANNRQITREELRNLVAERFGVAYTENLNNEVADIKNAIRNRKINVSDEVKADFIEGNRSTYGQFFKNNFGKIRFSKEGIGVDVLYEELSDNYPYFFPADVLNSADQLRRIAEVASLPSSELVADPLDDITIDDATDFIFDSVTEYRESEDYLERANVDGALQAKLKRIDDSFARSKKTLDEKYEVGSNEYNKSLKELSEATEKDREKARNWARAKQKNIKRGTYSKEVSDMVGDTTTWKDYKYGFQYQINTLRRNLRQIVRDERGNQDFAKADEIYEYLQGSYNRNEAELKKESQRIKKFFADLNINKYESEYAQKLGELRHNPDTTLLSENVEKFYQEHKNQINKEKVEKIITEARKVYDELIVRVNAVLREQGMKEIGYRKGYFPHFVEDRQGFLGKLLNWKTQNNDIPTDIAGITEMFEPVRSYQSFDKHREGDTTTYDFLKGFDTYVHGALDWIYHIEDIQRRRAFENEIRYRHSDKGIKERIDKINADSDLDADEAQSLIDAVYAEARNPLNNFITDFHNGTNYLAGKKSATDRGLEYATNRKIYSTMTNLSSRVSANMVGGSLSSALTNFIPITQSWGQVSPTKSLLAIRDVIKNTIKSDGLVEKSTFLTNRLLKEENLSKTTWDKVSDAVSGLMNVIDEFTSQVVWRSKYIDNIEKGMSQNEAIANADIFAENVIAGRSRGNMPTIFNSKNPAIKMLTAFQLEVNNQYGYMFKDMPQDLAGQNKGKLIKGYLSMFLGAYAYNALYSTLTGRDTAFSPLDILGDLMKDLGILDGDEEDEEANPFDAIRGLGENIAQEIPFVGGLFGGGRIPISSAMPYDLNLGDMLTDIEGMMTAEDKEKYRKSFMNELTKPLMYTVLPVGGGQLKKTMQGLNMFSEDIGPVAGSYTNSGNLRFPVEKTPLNMLQAGLFGQYSSKNAREYFDNDYAPLSPKQTAEYAQVGMSFTDYHKYLKGLRKQNTVAEKFDYINGLNLSAEQKNLLINNIITRDTPIDMTEYGDYGSYEEFDFATKHPEEYNVAKAVGGFEAYTTYAAALNEIESDKNASGKTINGSRKRKVVEYLNTLDAEYGEKLIIFRAEYPGDDTYNAAIIEYLKERDDMTYAEKVETLTALGMIVDSNGNVSW